MKKYIFTAVIVIAIAGYVLYSRSLNQKESVINDQIVGAVRYKDGEYLGEVVDFLFGKFQVKAIIINGRLTDVGFPIYPNDNPTSIRINEEAIPIWKSEAIKIQNATMDINIITNATDSTGAFNRSLQSALLQAANS